MNDTAKARAVCLAWWGSDDYPQKDDFENLVKRVALALKEERRSVQNEVIQAAYRPRPMCRDCADSDGRCQNSGEPCDPYEAALERLAKGEKE